MKTRPKTSAHNQTKNTPQKTTGFFPPKQLFSGRFPRNFKLFIRQSIYLVTNGLNKTIHLQSEKM
jgi:hypothetical protein